MIRVVYVTTSLSDKGPLQQLFNIIAALDRNKFEPVVLSLSAQFEGDKTELFDTLGIEILHCPWKWSYILVPFVFFRGLLKTLKPQIVHTSGFLPDVLCAFCGLRCIRVLTIRNDPFVDYPLKFGFVVGHFMAALHLLAIRLCPLPVACSSGLSEAFKKYRASTKIVRNGVNLDFPQHKKKTRLKTSKKMRFLTAGSLIKRKNVELMVSLFSAKNLCDISELIVLGDGALHGQCLSLSKRNIIFEGHVADIRPYFSDCDCYISLSKSEGMPNSVMEALVGGLPCMLSSIEAHQEIKMLMPRDSFLLDIDASRRELEEQLRNFILDSEAFNHYDIADKSKKVFDSKINSAEYQKIYLDNMSNI